MLGCYGIGDQTKSFSGVSSFCHVAPVFTFIRKVYLNAIPEVNNW